MAGPVGQTEPALDLFWKGNIRDYIILATARQPRAGSKRPAPLRAPVRQPALAAAAGDADQARRRSGTPQTPRARRSAAESSACPRTGAQAPRSPWRSEIVAVGLATWFVLSFEYSWLITQNSRFTT